MAAERTGAPYRPSRRNRTTGDVINDIAVMASRLAAAVFLLALAYMLYAVFSGGLKHYPTDYTPALAQQLTQNVHVASSALLWSAGALVLCITILLWGWEWAAVFFLVAGALLYVGLPYFGVPNISKAAMTLARAPQPGAVIVQAWRAAGMVCFGAGGLFILGWAWDQLQVSLASSRRIGGGLKVPFYSACWQTHYCKAEINKLCVPGRKGFRKSCWRHKSGCFCDESIGDKVLASARRQAGPEAEKFFGPRAASPSPTFADHFRSTHYRVAGQRIACADCPIYNYHEVQKHRILTPVAIVSVPALMYYYGAALSGGYRALVGNLDRFALHLGFSADSTRLLTNQIHNAFGEPIVENMVYALICVVLITTAARFLEYWCFEAKL